MSDPHTTPRNPSAERAYPILYALCAVPPLSRQGKSQEHLAQALARAYCRSYLAPYEFQYPELIGDPDYLRISSILVTYLCTEEFEVGVAALMESPIHQMCGLVADVLHQCSTCFGELVDLDDPRDAQRLEILDKPFSLAADCIITLLMLPYRVRATKIAMNDWWYKAAFTR